MSDGTGTTTWAWDNASRNTGYTQGAVGQGIAYGYDAENHRTSMVAAPSSGGGQPWTTTYGYDSAGRLKTLLDNRVSAVSPFTYAYQNGTNWIAGHSNADGSASLNQYDVLGRLTRVTAAGPSGAAINTYGYSYDAAGQRTQEASTVGTRNFGYDNQRQLTSAYRVDGSGNPLPAYNFGYAFDPIGNWTQATSAAGTTTFSANHLNQYTGISGAGFAQPTTPQYDADGNMTSDGKGNTYIYDEENRLVEVDTPNNPSIAKTVSVYDGLSRRVEKRTYNSGGTLLSTTRYLYDGLLPIAEYDSGNNLTTSYTRGLDLSGTMQGAGGISGLLALTNAAGNSYSYFADGNGNIVDLTDAYGSSAAHYEYDPFGNLVAQSGSLQQSYLWSSKEVDASTGLAYYLYRFYGPSLGRWINRDPVNEVGGFNLYVFVNNNDNSYLDKFGFEKQEKTNCREISENAEFAAYDLIGGKIYARASGEICDCKCNENINKRDYIKVGLTIGGQVGIGAELEFKIFGAKFGGGLEAFQVPMYTTGFYEKECGEKKGAVKLEYHVSGVIGNELGLGEIGGISGSYALEFSLYVGATLHRDGAEIYAGASIVMDAEFTYNTGLYEITKTNHLYEKSKEFPLGHLSW